MPVYFIRAGMSGPVKIGVADDVSERVAALQTAHYERLTIIRTVAGGPETERAFHDRYSRQRIRGEWFQYSDDMLAAAPEPMAHVVPPRDEANPLLAEDRATLAAIRARFPSRAAMAEAFGAELEAMRKWSRRGGIPTKYRWRARQLLEPAA